MVWPPMVTECWVVEILSFASAGGRALRGSSRGASARAPVSGARGGFRGGGFGAVLGVGRRRRFAACAGRRGLAVRSGFRRLCEEREDGERQQRGEHRFFHGGAL